MPWRRDTDTWTLNITRRFVANIIIEEKEKKKEKSIPID